MKALPCLANQLTTCGEKTEKMVKDAHYYGRLEGLILLVFVSEAVQILLQGKLNSIGLGFKYGFKLSSRNTTKKR